MTLTIHIQIKYSVLLSSCIGGHTSILATVGRISLGHSKCVTIWTDPTQQNSKKIQSEKNILSRNNYYFILSTAR